MGGFPQDSPLTWGRGSGERERQKTSGRGVRSAPVELWENPMYFLPNPYLQHMAGGGEESKRSRVQGRKRSLDKKKWDEEKRKKTREAIK